MLDYERYHKGLMYKTSNHYRQFIESTYTNDAWSHNGVEDLESDTQVLAYVFGRSDANYSQKYLSQKQDWYFDFDVRVGFSFTSAKIKGRLDKKPSDISGLYFGSSLTLGKIWYYRLSTLSNIGGYIRLAYNLEMENTQSSDIKDDEPSEGETAVTVNDSSYLRHGPLLSMTATF